MTIALIIIAAALFFLIGLISNRRSNPVKIAYAGTADSAPTVKRIPAQRNKTIYTDNGERVNLSGYDCFLISGKSLIKQGLMPGTFVYTLPSTDISDTKGRFLIFRYDVARQAIEHPDKKVTDDSYKARKGVMTIDTGLSEADFKHHIASLINNDSEIEDKEAACHRLWEKYKTASDFYQGQPQLIVSMTYKNDGERKAYSFHSPKFLVGIVRYISVD